MAANKFATTLHRNTNRITLILIYAGLEWTLILLVLLNSLFSYLIMKFADYFGLKPPCSWCSRIDHFFEQGKNKNLHRDHLCETHATEISRLGYCLNHQKLAVYEDMCEDCSSSRPDFHKVLSNSFDFLPVLKQFEMFQSDEDAVIEREDVGFMCSCCGVNVEKKSSNPSWDFLEYLGKENLIMEVETNDVNSLKRGNSDKIRSDLMSDCFEDDHGFEIKFENQMLSTINEDFGVAEQEEEAESEAKADDSSVPEPKLGLKEFENIEDDKEPTKEDKSYLDQIPNEIKGLVDLNREEGSQEIIPQHLEFFIDCSGHQLVPIELFDSPKEDKNEIRFRAEEDKLHSESNDQTQAEPSEENKWSVWEPEELKSVHLETEECKFADFELMEMEETDNALVFHCGPVYEQVAQDIDDTQEIEVTDLNAPTVFEEASQMQMNETEPDVSIGTKIPDLDLTVEIQAQESLFSYSCTHDDPSTSSLSLCRDDDHGTNEGEEERIPDTPTSLENLHHLSKKLLLLERKEYGGEESLDGSVISDFEGSEGVLTVERLTSALKSERKALNALYTELEEERSASAVAANQTMAMINRLQEEKAAMQMEALQYQRMMEEQSEYDQEAMQILNELMVKREKEKQELERELDLYRKRVSDYEARDKIRILRRRSKDGGSARSGTSCASFSNAEDSDELSFDLNQECKEEDQESENQNTPVDAILNLGDPLSDFEEERILILEQLKVLEEKLLTLSDAEEQHFEDARPIDDFYKENGKHFNGDSDSDHEGITNGFCKETNGKHDYQERRMMGSKPKRLLPLFDAISIESEDGEFINGHENGFQSNKFQISNVGRLELENKRVAIEEEVDQVYERLQDLEADRGFVKNCVSSLKKGDKGMDLLQEILQHLRDLRDVEIRARNSTDGSSV